MSPPHLAGILSTSRMIALIEDTCLAAIQPLLGQGQTTVGTRVDVSHVGTAWAGEEITVCIRLEKITRGASAQLRGRGGSAARDHQLRHPFNAWSSSGRGSRRGRSLRSPPASTR